MGFIRNFVDTRLRRMLRDSAWMMVAAGIAAVFGVVQVVVATRLLGPDGYGALALIMAVTVTVRQFVGVRTWEWAMREFARAYTERDVPYAADVVKRGYLTGAIVNGIALVIVVLGSTFAAERFVHDRSAAPLVAGYGAVLLVSWTYDTSFAVLRVAGQFRYLAIQQVVMSILRILLIGGAVVVWRRLDVAVITYVMVEVVASLWLALAAAQAFRSELGAPWWRVASQGRRSPDMAKLMVISWLVDTLKFAGGRVDLLVLGYYRSKAVVGNYQAAWNFLDMAQRLTQPVTMVAFADLAKINAAGQGRELLRVIGKLTIIALVVVVPACALLLLIAPLLCQIAYGAAYPDAPELLQLLAFSLLWLVALWMHPAFVSLGKPGWSLEVVIVVSTVKVAFLIGLVPAHGAFGVAIANLACCIAMPMLIPLYLVRARRWIASPAYAARFPSLHRDDELLLVQDPGAGDRAEQPA